MIDISSGVAVKYRSKKYNVSRVVSIGDKIEIACVEKKELKPVIFDKKIAITQMLNGCSVINGDSCVYFYDKVKGAFVSENGVYLDINAMKQDGWSISNKPKYKTGKDLIGMLCVVENGEYIGIEVVKKFENDEYIDNDERAWLIAKPIPKETLEKWMEFYEMD